MTIKEICTSKTSRNIVLIAILLNAVTLGLETSQYLLGKFGTFLYLCDKIFLAIFTVEIAAKIYAFRTDYFKDPWNLFDFVIVAIAYVPTSGPLTVFRSLRILRVLLVISFLPRLRLIVQSLLYALPGIGWISLLMIIIFYIFAVMATKLFGSAFPEWFGDLGESFFTLFQIMTLESWAMGLVRPISQQFPYAFLFFVPFVLISSFVVLNVFIAIIVNGMSDTRKILENTFETDTNDNFQDMNGNISAEHEVNKLKMEFAHLRENLTRIEQHLNLMAEKTVKEQQTRKTR